MIYNWTLSRRFKRIKRFKPFHLPILQQEDLTYEMLECIIDLKRLSNWEIYLLWLTTIDELGVRPISLLTGISKSLVATDLRCLDATFRELREQTD